MVYPLDEEFGHTSCVDSLVTRDRDGLLGQPVDHDHDLVVSGLVLREFLEVNAEVLHWPIRNW